MATESWKAGSYRPWYTTPCSQCLELWPSASGPGSRGYRVQGLEFGV